MTEKSKTIQGRTGPWEIVIGLEVHAQKVGVTGVPFFIVDGKLAVSGAQPPEVWGQVFQQVFAAQTPQQEPEF